LFTKGPSDQDAGFGFYHLKEQQQQDMLADYSAHSVAQMEQMFFLEGPCLTGSLPPFLDGSA